MMRVTPTLALAALAVALAPGCASASTIILRPSGTQQMQAPWAVSPPGTPADVTLADPVIQPAAPPLTGATLTAGAGINAYTKVTLPTPSIPAGATPTAVTTWVYFSVGAPQALTASLSAGDALLQFIPGPAAWHSFKVSPVPSAAQLAHLVLSLRTDGIPIGPAMKVYAAYVQIDVADAARPAGPAGASPSAAQPGDDAGDDGGSSAGDDVADDPIGTSGPVTSATISAPATVQLAAGAKAVPVQVACPADQGGPCRGRVRIELAPAATTRKVKSKAKDRAARCARGCRVLGDSSFTIAAGKKAPVKVRLRPASFKLLPRGRTVKARVTVTSRDQSGKLSTVTRAIAIHRARY
jgi:hypothetical protein